MAFVESEVVELKAEVVGDICKEVIAFANTKGGTLYIGVSDDGSVVGVKNADQVILQLNNMIRDSIKPDVTMFVGYETQHVGDKDIIAVTIQKGTDRPYYLGSKGFQFRVRVGVHDFRHTCSVCFNQLQTIKYGCQLGVSANRKSQHNVVQFNAGGQSTHRDKFNPVRIYADKGTCTERIVSVNQ